VRREEQTQRPSSSPSARRPAARRRGARAQARGAAHSCRHRSSFARARAQAPGRERAQQHPAAATSPCFKRARAQVSGRKRPSAIARGARAQVPAVLLVCRNSTDTAYFQRLRPYPRVLLRRQNARFKARAGAPRAVAGVLACGRPRLPTHSLDCARKCTC